MGKITSLGFGKKPKGKSIGSPAWRAAGRPGKGGMPVKPAEEPPEPVDDISALTPEQKADKALDALLEMGMSKNPGRHAMARRGALTDALPYLKSRMPQKTELTGEGGGPMESRHEIVFVKPEGR